MRQPLNANPPARRTGATSLEQDQETEHGGEITELLNHELSPGDNPFSEAEVDRWLRDNREKVLQIGCGIAHSDECQTALSEFRLLAKSGELTVNQSLRASGSRAGSRYQNPARAGTMDCWRGFHHAFDSQQKHRLR
jgi:hypothetical protein